MKHFFTFLLALSCATLSAQTVYDSIRSLVPRSTDSYRYAYQQLTAADRATYDTIIDAFLHFDANNYAPYQYHRVAFPDPVDIMSVYTVKDFINQILCDVPELYIIQSTVPGYDWDTYVCFGRVGYQNAPDSYLSELQRLTQLYDSFSSAFTPGMTDYQRLRILHDAFINWGDYGDMTGADAGNLRGALINRRAVCEGFARAGLFLCQRAGIPCIYISGQLCTSTTNNTWTNHSWNYVYIRGAVPPSVGYPATDASGGGAWYLMDLTTDGGFPNVCGYSAFLRGQDYLDANYRLYSADGTYPNTVAYGGLPTLAPTTYVPDTTGTTTSLIGSSVLPADQSSSHPEKFIHNGRLLIRKNGYLFDASGRRVARL